MIETIRISNVATFKGDEQVFDGLSKVNFIYGANGSGKTIISRIIADADNYPSCTVNWKEGFKLKTVVYNRDFIDRNFYSSTELKGVFTIGEDNVKTIAKIETATKELEGLNTKLNNLTLQLQSHDGKSGKIIELNNLEEELQRTCWKQKKKHDVNLQGVLVEDLEIAEKFKTKILTELSSNTSDFLPLEELEKRAEIVFGKTPTFEPSISLVDFVPLQKYESDIVLKKCVIGKSDVDIAGMIRKLGNSDWVRAGRSYYKENNGTCPFCQQRTDEAFTKSINEYFDEAFEIDSKSIENVLTDYKVDAECLYQQILEIVAVPSRFLNIEKMNAERRLLASRIKINLHRLEEKNKVSSNIIVLESVSNVAKAVKALIDEANTKIAKHNKIVENLPAEKKALTSQVWKFLLEELKDDLDRYHRKSNGLEREINSIKVSIKIAEEERAKKTNFIEDLEKQTTSVQPTCDGINELLKKFGFYSFSLKVAENRFSYKLVRPDGTSAKETLSDGEKSFIMFLYFYYFLKGSNLNKGTTVDRIVVIDDPVSSLDSDVLFVVSSLIKNLFDETKADNIHIKQIFVLTHNVYFHKEVAYKIEKITSPSFWIVKKSSSGSLINRYKKNPISSFYELLWEEVRNPDLSNQTLKNTLRRILEYYFRILGGIDFDAVYEKFADNEKVVYKTLIAWVQNGSRSIFDDVYVSSNDQSPEIYLKVFEKIFKKSGHYAHYKMMMRDDGFVLDMPMPDKDSDTETIAS